jgi:hypothetical protein
VNAQHHDTRDDHRGYEREYAAMISSIPIVPPSGNVSGQFFTICESLEGWGERGSAFKGEIEEATLKRYLLLGFPQEWLMAVWLLPTTQPRT